MTHHTSWLERTRVCGVRQNQAGGSSVQTGAVGAKLSIKAQAVAGSMAS